MSIEVLEDLCRNIQSKDIFYISYGKLTQNILQSLVATTRSGVYDYSSKVQYDNAQISNLVSVAIEMVQNASKYRENIDNYNSDLVLVTTNGGIKVSTSNLTHKNNQDKMSKNIDFINSLDNKELRKHSREIMRKTRTDDTNSAGLGLIEIARLSSEKIHYSFVPYNKDANLSHFNMTISV